MSEHSAPDYAYLSDEEGEVFFEVDPGHLIYEERTYGTPILSMRTCRDSKSNCRCAALGEDVTCSVYDIRPNVCRKFEPGSTVCEIARQVIFGVSNR